MDAYSLWKFHSIRERLTRSSHINSSYNPKALAKDAIDIDEVFGISFPDENLSIQTHNLGAIHAQLPRIIVENNHKLTTIDKLDDDLASIFGYLTSGGRGDGNKTGFHIPLLDRKAAAIVEFSASAIPYKEINMGCFKRRFHCFIAHLYDLHRRDEFRI